MNDNKILIILISFGIIFTLGIAGFLYFDSNSSQTNESQNPISERSNISPTSSNQKVTPISEKTVAIGSEKVTRGEYQKIEGSLIYYFDVENKYKKLKDDSLLLACTGQGDLETTGELDYNQIKRLNSVTPSELSLRLKSGMNIVMLSESIDSELIVHTVATTESVCK